jgi:hypothetical protein
MTRKNISIIMLTVMILIFIVLCLIKTDVSIYIGKMIT